MTDYIQITETARLVVDPDDDAQEPSAQEMGFDLKSPEERSTFAGVHAQWANGGVMTVSLERRTTYVKVDGNGVPTGEFRDLWDVADSLGGCYLEDESDGPNAYTAAQCALDAFDLTGEEQTALTAMLPKSPEAGL